MNANSKWSLKKDVFLEIDPDGKSGMLIDTTSSNYCSCNKTALLILGKLKKGKARSKQFGRVEIPQEAFIGVLKINKEK